MTEIRRASARDRGGQFINSDILALGQLANKLLAVGFVSESHIWVHTLSKQVFYEHLYSRIFNKTLLTLHIIINTLCVDKVWSINDVLRKSGVGKWGAILLCGYSVSHEHYPSQCWPSLMSRYGVTMPQWPQWVKICHMLQGCFTASGAIIRLPQWQWSNPEEYVYNKPLRSTYILDMITIKHTKAPTASISLGMYSTTD